MKAKYNEDMLHRYALDSVPCHERAFVGKGGEIDNCYCSHCGAFVGHGGQKACPDCGRTFTQAPYYGRVLRSYFTIITHDRKGQIVERFYQVCASPAIRKEIRLLSIAEVFRLTLDNKGKVHCIGYPIGCQIGRTTETTTYSPIQAHGESVRRTAIKYS